MNCHYKCWAAKKHPIHEQPKSIIEVILIARYPELIEAPINFISLIISKMCSIFFDIYFSMDKLKQLLVKSTKQNVVMLKQAGMRI